MSPRRALGRTLLGTAGPARLPPRPDGPGPGAGARARSATRIRALQIGLGWGDHHAAALGPGVSERGRRGHRVAPRARGRGCRRRPPARSWATTNRGALWEHRRCVVQAWCRRWVRRTITRAADRARAARGEVGPCTATPTSSPPRCSTPTGAAARRRRVGPVLPRPDQPVAARGRLRRHTDGPRAGPAARPLRRPRRRHVTDVQRQGGYVTGGHRGRAIPARLEITALVENAVPGEPTMRLHTHIYVGRTATALDTGERHPVDLERAAQRAANFAWRRLPSAAGERDDRRPRVGLGAAARPHLGRSSRSSTRRWPSTSPATGSGSARASTARASRSWPTPAGVPAWPSPRGSSPPSGRRRTG